MLWPSNHAEDRGSVTSGDERPSVRAAETGEHGLPGGDVTVEEMSEASFPASDPPATWIWELPTAARERAAPQATSRTNDED
jgi:hypothetical protein